MKTVQFKKKKIKVRGIYCGSQECLFLVNLDDYSVEWAQYVAKEESIEFIDEHEVVIKMIRDYYKKNGIAPFIRVITKITRFKLKHLWELFPSGMQKGACRMAGLPNGLGCV